jgi:hypothetical protein
MKTLLNEVFRFVKNSSSPSLNLCYTREILGMEIARLYLSTYKFNKITYNNLEQRVVF